MIEINKPYQTEKFDLISDDYIAEPKYDGMRGIINTDDGYKLLSDKGNVKNLQFPEIRPILPDNTIVDGEICILENEFSADFTKLQPRIAQGNPMMIKMLSEKTPAVFMAFDILQLEGQDLRHHTYKQRREILSNLIRKDVGLQLVSAGDPDMMRKKVIDLNGEGIVMKKLDSLYDSKWIKLKNWKEGDFKVKSFTSEKRLITALELVDTDGMYVGKVNYTGYPYTQEWADKIIGMTAVVKYLGKGDKLRIPILKELRS